MKKSAIKRAVSLPAVKCLAAVTVGLILPLGTPVSGVRPMGVAFVASREKPDELISAAFGVFCGHLISGGWLGMILAGAAVMICVIRLCLSGFAVLRKEWFPSVTAAAVTAVFLAPSGIPLKTYVGSVIMTGFFSFLFLHRGSGRLPTDRLFILMAVFLSFDPFFKVFSPYLLSASFMAVATGRKKGPAFGGFIGLVSGMLYSPGTVLSATAAALMTLCGLISGAGSRRPAVWVCLSTAVSCGLAAMWLGGFNIYLHIFCASIIYCLLPFKFRAPLTEAVTADTSSDLAEAFLNLGERFSEEPSLSAAMSAMQCRAAGDAVKTALRRPEKEWLTAAGTIARAYRPSAKASVSSRDGLTVTVSPALDDGYSFSKSLGDALNMDFTVTEDGPDYTRVKRQETVSMTVHTLTRSRERVSGDSEIHFRCPDGRMVVMLSDGMGTGREARELSDDALTLIRGFMEAGADAVSALEAVMPLLSARFLSRGFVTLDIMEADPFSGNVKILKLGAPASYHIKDNRVFRVGERTLPAGIEPDIPRPREIKVNVGDRIVMMTDGTCENGLSGINWLAPSGELCRELLNNAAQNGGTDDMTAVVITVEDH